MLFRDHLRAIKTLFVLALFSLGFLGCTSSSDEATSEPVEQSDQQDAATLGDNGLTLEEQEVELGETNENENVNPIEFEDQEAMDAGAEQGMAQALKEDSKPMEMEAQAPAQEMMPTMVADEQNESLSYIVRKGDSLSLIARRAYGDLSQWKQLAQVNANISNPNRIFPGDVISIPLNSDKAKSFAKKYHNMEETSRVTEVVKPGDTLEKIAKRVLGEDGNWKQVWQQNRTKISNPHMIQIGQEVIISTALFSLAH